MTQPIVIKKLDNSFIQIKNFDSKIASKLREEFSFYPPNYRFHPKFKTGMWNGLIHLFNTQTGKLPIGLAKKAYQIIRSETTDIVMDFSIFDKGIEISEKEIKDFCKLIKFEHTPYDHQIEAVRKCLKQKRLTIESATSSGKSLNLFLICNFLLMNNSKEKIIIIVPSVQLVEQLSKDFQDYAKNWIDYSKFVHKIYSGQDKLSNKQITISTEVKNGNVVASLTNNFGVDFKLGNPLASWGYE